MDSPPAKRPKTDAPPAAACLFCNETWPFEEKVTSPCYHTYHALCVAGWNKLKEEDDYQRYEGITLCKARDCPTDLDEWIRAYQFLSPVPEFMTGQSPTASLNQDIASGDLGEEFQHQDGTPAPLQRQTEPERRPDDGAEGDSLSNPMNLDDINVDPSPLEAYLSTAILTDAEKDNVRDSLSRMQTVYQLNPEEAFKWQHGNDKDYCSLAYDFSIAEHLLSEFDTQKLFSAFLELRAVAGVAQALEARGINPAALPGGEDQSEQDLELDCVICLRSRVEENDHWRCVRELFVCCQVAETIGERERGTGVSASDILDSYIEKEDAILKFPHPDKYEKRKREWDRRKTIGNRVLPVVKALGYGVLLFVPESMSPNKIVRWTTVVGNVFAHCVQNLASPLGMELRALAEVCNEVCENFWRFHLRHEIPSSIDVITTYYAGIIFRLSPDVQVQAYVDKVREIQGIPRTPLPHDNSAIVKDDLESFRGQQWPTATAGAVLIDLMSREYRSSVEEEDRSLVVLPLSRWMNDNERATVNPGLELVPGIDNIVPIYCDAHDDTGTKGYWYVVVLNQAREQARVYLFHQHAQMVLADGFRNVLRDCIKNNQPEWHALISQYKAEASPIQSASESPQDQLFALLQHLAALLAGKPIDPQTVADNEDMRDRGMLDVFDFVLRGAFESEQGRLTDLDAKVGRKSLTAMFHSALELED